MNDDARAADTRRAMAVAKLTDQRFLDPLLGLVLPGLGDAAGAVVGLYIVALARKHELPAAVQARMLVNLAVDCLGGLVPIAGDVFDLLNRANLRNARLLERHLSPGASPPAEPPQSKARVVLAGALLAAALGAAGVVLFLALRRLFH